jgi:hypothetical protein
MRKLSIYAQINNLIYGNAYIIARIGTQLCKDIYSGIGGGAGMVVGNATDVIGLTSPLAICFVDKTSSFP